MNMHAKVTAGKKLVWNDETKQKMASLWNDGVSAGEIGKRFGVSKNAIIGIVHRNEDLFKPREKRSPLFARTRGKKPVPRLPGEARVKPTHSHVGNNVKNIHKARMDAARREADEFEAGTSEYLQIAPTDAERLNSGKELMDLGLHECRWALTNGGPFIFCAEATDGAVYCRHHAERAYTVREAR